MTNRKKILITIIAIILLGLIFEAGSYLWQSNRLVKQGYRFDGNTKIPPYPTTIMSFSKHYFERLDKERIINNVIGEKEYKSPAIIMFGDVFVNSFVNSDNTFAHKISKATKRPVYNMGESGWGISQMYFLLKNEKALDKINPETIVFVYHSDMKNRLTSFSFYPHHKFLNLKYKIKDDKLIEDNPILPFVYHSYGIRNIERYIGWRKATSKIKAIQEKNLELIEELFEESKEIAEEKYPNLKNFIILRFPPDWETLEKLEEYSLYDKIAKAEYHMWKELEEEGFIIVDATTLTNVDLNRQRHFATDCSIKPETLDLIIPAFIAETEIKAKEPVIKKKTTVKKPIQKKKVKKAITKQETGSKNISETVKTEKCESTEKIETTLQEKDIATSEENQPKKKRFWDRFKRKKKDTIDN